MPLYRIYQLDSGHVFAPPKIVVANTDAEIVAQAMNWVDGYDLEIWDEARRVGLVERCDEKPAA